MYKLAVIALLALAPSAHGEGPLARVQGIENAGLEAGIYEILGTSKANPEDEIAIRRDLRTAEDRVDRYLRAQGYYAASIDAEIGDDGRPVLTIDSGPAFSIRNIAIETGNREADMTARMAVEPPEDNILSAAWVLAAEAEAQAALENAGWPEADTLPREVVIDHASTSGDVRFLIEPGPFTRYGGTRLQTEGWRPDFIHRLTALEEGAPVRLSAIQAFERRLEGLSSVREARIDLADMADGETTRALDVSLTPAPRHAIETTISLSTTEGAGTSLSWSRRNLFGGDETLTLTAELASLVQSLGAEMSLPYWQRIDQRLSLNTGVKSEDTDAFQQNEFTAGVTLFRELREDLDVRVGGLVDISRVTDASGERDIHSLRLTSAIALDQRDDPLDPQSGVQAALIVNPGFSFGDADATYLQTEIRTSAYYPISNHFTAAARIRLGTIVGASAIDLAADQRFYAGGGGSARGFEYQSLSPIGPDGAPAGGLSVSELNAELRWRGEGRWGAVAFVDTAFAGASRTPEFDNLRTGVGMGLRYYFDFAPVRFDVATPLDRRSGEDPVHVYISIGQAF
ncbi:autotransporter assembly complex family protein [Hyphobacterium sp.]|uniref:autotransporter assembly complex protein TamA n=1 Tax=Hyphobacterium sp. TaxID=2004662 RepID=UPI003749716B